MIVGFSQYRMSLAFQPLLEKIERFANVEYTKCAIFERQKELGMSRTSTDSRVTIPKIKISKFRNPVRVAAWRLLGK